MRALAYSCASRARRGRGATRRRVSGRGGASGRARVGRSVQAPRRDARRPNATPSVTPFMRVGHAQPTPHLPGVLLEKGEIHAASRAPNVRPSGSVHAAAHLPQRRRHPGSWQLPSRRGLSHRWCHRPPPRADARDAVATCGGGRRPCTPSRRSRCYTIANSRAEQNGPGAARAMGGRGRRTNRQKGCEGTGGEQEAGGHRGERARSMKESPKYETVGTKEEMGQNS